MANYAHINGLFSSIHREHTTCEYAINIAKLEYTCTINGFSKSKHLLTLLIICNRNFVHMYMQVYVLYFYYFFDLLLAKSGSEVFRIHRMETRCHWLGVGQSHDVCRSQ